MTELEWHYQCQRLKRNMAKAIGYAREEESGRPYDIDHTPQEMEVIFTFRPAEFG